MDILFSCYRASFSPNDRYLIEDALNTVDQHDVEPCSPVHALALYAKEVTDSPGRLNVPKRQIEWFNDNDEEGDVYFADLVIARAEDEDPVVFFNVIRKEEAADHSMEVTPSFETPIAVTSQPVKSSVTPGRREWFFSQQREDYMAQYVANPKSWYPEYTHVFLHHNVQVATAEVERAIDGFVPVEWSGDAWFTPLSHVGHDFFSSTADNGPEAVCSAVLVSRDHPGSHAAVSFL